MFMKIDDTDEKRIYTSLSEITKSKSNWEALIPDVGKLLDHSSDKIKAKTLWLMGEMGYKHTNQIEPFVSKIAVMLYDGNEKLRERAVGALGRIGRGNIFLILPYIDKMLCMANDSVPAVRMNFIWASENIATNNPDIFKNHMSIFANLLNDRSIRVRMEAPEIFRVIGKRKPEYVKPYLVKLGLMAQNDPDRVVRIHSSGAIRATMEKADR